MARRQIGTVTVNRARVYPLDPWLPSHVNGTEVIVSPGTFPVFQAGISSYWQMTGVLNHRSFRIGDGMLAMSSSGRDVASDDDVTFYSPRYGPDEWQALLAEFSAEGSALTFTIPEAEAPS